MPRISVIMPAYNAKDYISDAIESILIQSFRDFELIIVNDGSTDSTLDILESYAEADHRIHIITRPNGGPGHARNAGLNAASGEYVMLVDADDQMHPDCLQTFAAELDTSPDMVACGYLLKEPNLPDRAFTRKGIRCYTHALFLKLLPDLIAKQLAYVPWNKMIKRSIIEENNIRFTNYRSCEDRLFNLACYAHVHSFTFIEQPLYNYYIRGEDALNSRFLPDRHEALDAFYEELLALYGGNPDAYTKSTFAAAYVKGIYACILSTMHRSCMLDNAGKRAYIRTLLKLPHLKDALKSCPSGMSMLLPKLALKSKRITLCRGCAALIRFANKRMHGLYLKLKHSK